MAEEYGLQINKEKSKIILFNDKEQPENIEGIQVGDNITYLGVKISNKRNCYSEYEKERLNKANQLANMTYSITSRCCNRLIIGKNYWKGLGLSVILYAAENVEYNKEDLQKLQQIENSVHRAILQTPTYTASTALRGEVGATSCTARDMKIKLLYAKNLLEEGGNELCREIFHFEYEKGKSSWIRTLKKYMREGNVTLEGLKNIKKNGIVDRIIKWDSQAWVTEIQQKQL